MFWKNMASNKLNSKQDNFSIPFPEWSDMDVNEENWDRQTHKDKTSITEQFTDPHRVNLPPSLAVFEWKRPKELFPETEFVIHTDKSEHLDLIGNNGHILQSEFMRSFISSIELLWFLTDSFNFSWEFVSSQCFLDSTNHWRPWMHIYSKCKAGKGIQHIPIVNRSGKYIVRLFWLGSWRKIYVDDLIPIDENSHILLPTLKAIQHRHDIKASTRRERADDVILSSNRGRKSKSEVKGGVKATREKVDSLEKPKIIQMWPFLLCKALLKVASFTWYGKQELIDFDIIYCLTGWIPYKYYTRSLCSDAVWNFCLEYTENYEWLEDKVNKSKSKAHYSNTKKENPCKPILTALFQGNDSKFLEYDFEGTHQFLICQTRNIPLMKPTKASDYPLWKRYRWIEWAAGEGLIPPLESSKEIKYLKIVDPFESLLNLDFAEDTTKKNDQQTIKSSEEKNDTVNKDTVRKNQLSQSLFDRSIWKDFKEIFQNIKCLIAYIKPSRYPVKIDVSEIEQKYMKLKSKRAISLDNSEWKEIFYPLSLKSYRNEPLYLFCDTFRNETIILNFCQVGFCEELKHDRNEIDLGSDEASSVSDESECGLCLNTILKRLKDKRERLKRSAECAETKQAVFYKPDHPRPKSCVVINKYNWRSNSQDDYVTSFSTLGSATVLINLKPGRHILRLYIRSERTYRLLMLSDNSVSVDNLHGILDLMTEEPCLLKDFCGHIERNFEKLIESFGKSKFDDYLRNFYFSFIPNGCNTKKDRQALREEFCNEIFREVEKEMGGEKANHLKIFLRRWQNPLRVMSSEFEDGFCYGMDKGDENLIKELNKAAQTIQAFFRGCLERNLLKYHDPHHEQFKIILDSLHGINDNFFSEKRDILPFVARKVFNKLVTTTSILQMYSFYDQINDTLDLIEFIEYNLKAATCGWIFICRKLFYVNQTLLLNITVYCDLPRFYIKVLNNDTKEERKYYTNNIAVYNFETNIHGYTLIFYGFANQQNQNFSYKIVLASDKNPYETLIKYISLHCKTESLSGIYLPNAQNIIGRCFFVIYSEKSVLSIRFVTSYNKVKINLRLSDSFGQICSGATGFGDVIIPAVILDGGTTSSSETDSTKKMSQKKGKSPKRLRRISNDSRKMSLPAVFYLIEAQIMEDSWPLSEADWKVVNRLKRDMMYVNRTSSDKIPRKRSANSSDSPYWLLQVTTNSEERTFLQKDRKKEEELMDMKLGWFDDRPGRYEKAQELRQKFLEENLIPNEGRITNPLLRSLNSTDFDAFIFPHFNLSEFEQEECIDMDKPVTVKSEEMLEEENNRRQEAIEDLNIVYENLTEGLNNVMMKQKIQYDTLNNWLEECRQESVQMSANVQRLRAEYLRVSKLHKK